MNRTVLFFAVAGALAVLALFAGAPGGGSGTHPIQTVSGQGAATAGSESIKLAGRLSHPTVLAGGSELFITAELTGAQVPNARRMPVNLALVVDRSGSMSGYKLDQAKLA